ncbi:hypothetical protein LSM04_006625 [Trypanosoma melophagium]|uniref:uncharacterized protein n=1 Tax=Trypanosoma melophagium TaxID=715481 RepID=UPI00351A8483|nr:hypothetical protein LSM04_001522 [Trypanosoma melophagium]KAH9593048.1 hypothetical protein LSM04_006625 [Trypanosoma melophagium]
MGNSSSKRSGSDPLQIGVGDNNSSGSRAISPMNDGFQGLDGLPSGMERERRFSEIIARRRVSMGKNADPWLLFPKREFVIKNTQSDNGTFSSISVSLPPLSSSISSFFHSTYSSFSASSSSAASNSRGRRTVRTGVQKSYTTGPKNNQRSSPSRNISNMHTTEKYLKHPNNIPSICSPFGAAVAATTVSPRAAGESRRLAFPNSVLATKKLRKEEDRNRNINTTIRAEGPTHDDLNVTINRRSTSVMFAENVEVLGDDGTAVNTDLVENNLYRESLARRCRLVSEESQ